MKQYTVSFLALSLYILFAIADASALSLKQISDLRSFAQSEALGLRPLLLVFTADDCPYCDQLANEILLPMIRSGEYEDRVIICALNLDGTSVRDFNGEVIEPWGFAQRYNVSVTPTMVLLDDRGRLLGEPLVGVRNLDFYEGYIANAIDQAKQRLSSTPNTQ